MRNDPGAPITIGRRRSPSSTFLGRVAAAAAVALLWTGAGCDNDDEPEPELGALVDATIARGGARYDITVRQGTPETISQVTLHGTGPTVSGATDFERDVRSLRFLDQDQPSAVVDGDQVFARPGHDPTAWGVAAVDDETLAALDLSQLIALHDPATWLRAVRDAPDDAVESDADDQPGHHVVRGLAADQLDDPITTGLTSQLGIGRIEVHLWSSDDDDPVVRRIAVPLRLGDRGFTDDPDSVPGAAAPIPELWIVVALVGDLDDLDDLDGFDDLAGLEPLGPDEVEARLEFAPFLGLADMIDPQGVPADPSPSPMRAPATGPDG